MPPSVVVSRRGADRIRAGHPWIYRTDVLRAQADRGDLVRVRTDRDRSLGWAFWSDTSKIAIRMVGFDPDIEHVEEPGLWRARLEAALTYRAGLGIDATAYRLVHGEADRLPGLVVDRYADWLVVQTLSQGMDRRLSMVVEVLVELVQPRGIVARNDPKVRRLEGLDPFVDVVYGEVPALVEVRERNVFYDVDLRQGQKTGLFLDQRENHEAAARYGHGRALDGFAYAGGFALALAPQCEHVLAVDSSAAAVRMVAAHAARNGFRNVEAIEANTFDVLRDLEQSGVRFDTIVLDPPAFARNRAAVPRALAGYREINVRALKLLSPGGHLVTCSCSYNVDEALFLDVLREAASDARAGVVVVDKRAQARDHPVLLNVPETYYLKCIVLRRLP